MGIRELILPLEDADFLVPGERVYYRRRQHGAALIAPIVEFIGAIAVFAWLLTARTASSVPLLLGFVAVAALGWWIWQLTRVRWASIQGARLVALAVGALMVSRGDGPTLGLLLVFGFALRLCLRAVRWQWFHRILVTDRRVAEIRGLLGSTVATMPLARVTDALVHRSPLAEVLGYAEFRVESAGQNQALARIPYLQDADRFHSIVVQLAARAAPEVPLDSDPDNPPRLFDPLAN